MESLIRIKSIPRGDVRMLLIIQYLLSSQNGPGSLQNKELNRISAQVIYNNAPSPCPFFSLNDSRNGVSNAFGKQIFYGLINSVGEPFFMCSLHTHLKRSLINLTSDNNQKQNKCIENEH